MAVDGFDERFKLAEDAELGLRLWKAGAVIINDKTLRVSHLKASYGGYRSGEKRRKEMLRVPEPRGLFLLLLVHFHMLQVCLEC